MPADDKRKSDDASDAAAGKWMVGIGLGLMLLIGYFVNAGKNDVIGSMTAEPATPIQQPSRDALNHRRAAAESVTVLGQKIVFSNPRGYCTPGKSAREAALVDLARRSLGEGSRLVHVAVRCAELEDFRDGWRDMLDHWLQIQLIGPKGDFRRVDMERESFLGGMSKSMPRVGSAAELDRLLNESFGTGDVKLSEVKVEPIGRDGNAVYFSLRMNMAVGEVSRPVTGISGITLLNSLPLSVNVYEATGSPQSRAQLQSVQREILNSLLTEN